MTDARTPANTLPQRSRALLWGAVGLLVFLAVAVVLLAATSTPSATAPAPTLATAPAEPGINAAAASLIQLAPQPSPLSMAPEMSLTGQFGKTVSISDFRGKSVVLAFNDDKCKDLCTLLAQDVIAANRDLGVHAKDVVFLSINANPYYPEVSTVKEWTDSHGLATAKYWVYATGSADQLAKAAASYNVPIKLDPKSKTVIHGTDLFFIDPSGHEAAVGQFGTQSASTELFAHTMAQAAVDLLPNPSQIHVGGPSPASTQTSAGASIYSPAPDFTLPQLAHPAATISLGDLHGKVTVVNFWASTCTACIAEMPAMEQEYNKLGTSMNFVGIDVADDPSTAAAFAAKYGISYPLLSDAAGTASGAYLVPGLPFTAVIDADGMLLVRHPGAMTAEQLDYVLQSVAHGGS